MFVHILDSSGRVVCLNVPEASTVGAASQHSLSWCPHPPIVRPSRSLPRPQPGCRVDNNSKHPARHVATCYSRCKRRIRNCFKNWKSPTHSALATTTRHPNSLVCPFAFSPAMTMTMMKVLKYVRQATTTMPIRQRAAASVVRLRPRVH